MIAVTGKTKLENDGKVIKIVCVCELKLGAEAEDFRLHVPVF